MRQHEALLAKDESYDLNYSYTSSNEETNNCKDQIQTQMTTIPHQTYLNKTGIDENDGNSQHKNKLLGVLCCIISIISWILLAHLLKNVQDDNNDKQYDKPFLLMFVSGSMYIILFILWYLIKRHSEKNKQPTNSNDDKSILNSFCTMFKLLLFPALLLSIIALFAEFIWALSLSETMVSVNTAICQSQIAFVYILSIIFLGTKVTLQKIVGVIICIIGVLSISYGAYTEEIESERDITTNSIKGIIILCISVLLHAILMIGIEYVSNKYFDTNKESQYMIYLQGLMGLTTLFVCWPVFFIFDKTNLETFQLPSNQNQWFVVALTAILSLVFWTSFFIGIVLTNAMFVIVVMLFALPTGYFSDIIIYSYISSIWAYIGTLLIVIGFLLTELPIIDYFKNKYNY